MTCHSGKGTRVNVQMNDGWFQDPGTDTLSYLTDFDDIISNCHGLLTVMNDAFFCEEGQEELKTIL